MLSARFCPSSALFLPCSCLSAPHSWPAVPDLASSIKRASDQSVVMELEKGDETALRAAGFKLHAHWMPNLLGATHDL